jgi:hypothetical protein
LLGKSFTKNNICVSIPIEEKTADKIPVAETLNILNCSNMKNLVKTGMTCLVLTLCLIKSSAQTNSFKQSQANKKQLFQHLPERVNAQISSLTALFNQPLGKSITINVSNDFVFEGMIVSAVSKFNNDLQNVVIKSTSHIGARLTFSKSKKEDGTFNYAGRIISPEHADCFVIIQEKGQYYFQKQITERVIIE